MTVKTKYIAIGIVILILALLGTGYYLGHRGASKASQGSIDILKGEITRYEVVLGDSKAYVTTLEQEKKTLQRAVRDGDIEREVMRKLHIKTVRDLTNAEITINILRDSVKHNGQIITIEKPVYYTDPRKAILLPFEFGDTTIYHKFYGKFNKDGVLKVGIQTIAELSIWAGTERKTKKDIAVVTCTNPEVTITKISSVTIDKGKPKKFGIGVQAGWGFNLQGTVKAQPYIGAGISYNIIRF